MKTALICHHDAPLSRHGIARWLSGFSELTGIVVIHEPPARLRKRVRFEMQRVGALRFLDVLAFRLYYRIVHAARDRAWADAKLLELERRYAPVPDNVPVHHTSDPNDADTEAFLRRVAPDLVVARCKVLLKPRIFQIPPSGTFVFHPGICPEYRNAHGCFWALARGDRDRVGMTLLRIDEGVDTGPVYGYYGYDVDEVGESHAVIQHRVVLDNLGALARALVEVHAGERDAIDTRGRRSSAWGHPWLSAHLRWKRTARRRRRAVERRHATVS